VACATGKYVSPSGLRFKRSCFVLVADIKSRFASPSGRFDFLLRIRPSGLIVIWAGCGLGWL